MRVIRVIKRLFQVVAIIGVWLALSTPAVRAGAILASATRYAVDGVYPEITSWNDTAPFPSAGIFARGPDLNCTNNVSPFVSDLLGGGWMTVGPHGTLYNARYLGQEGYLTTFDTATGAYLGRFTMTGPNGPMVGVTFGPNGNLYVHQGDYINRYDATTSAFLGTLVTVTNASDFAFGPDGNLYVNLYSAGQVERFNGITGQPLGIFTNGGGTYSAFESLTFGPDGNLYVADEGTDRIVRYNGTTGTFIDSFKSISVPQQMKFGPNGYLYVAGWNGGIGAYDTSDGHRVEIAAAAGHVFGVAFINSDTAVPEPSSLAIVGCAGVCVAVGAWRRQRKPRLIPPTC